MRIKVKQPSRPFAIQKTLDEVECVHLVKTLKVTAYDLNVAANRLGISLEELLQRLAKHAIPPYQEPFDQE